MLSYVKSFVKTLIDICRVEKGPQDVPRSFLLLGLMLILYTLVKFALESFLQPTDVALLRGGIETAVLVIVVGGMLAVRGLRHRIPQTLITLAAIGIAVTCVAIVGYAVLWLEPALLRIGVGRAFTIPLFLWNIGVNSHVFREALSSGLVLGIVVAASLFFIAWVATDNLAPVPATGARM
jgi:hypothetical protein